jgi:PAN-like domain/S-locus glycoprotein domain
MKTNSEFTFEYFTNQNDTYYTFNTSGTSFVSRLVLNQSYAQRYVSTGSGWKPYWLVPRDICDFYAQCGPNSLCNLDSTNSTDCTCLTGFEPKFVKNWNLHDTTAGCIRRVGLNCSSDGFITIDDVKLPESTNVTVYSTIGLSECRKMCLMNCSCTGYTNSNITGGGSGCAMWTGDLHDLRKFTGGGWTFYYRVAGSEVPGKHPSSSLSFFF